MKLNNVISVLFFVSIFWLVSCGGSKRNVEENMSDDEIKKRLDLLEQRVEFLLQQQTMEDAKKRAESEGFKVREIK